jgi:hypothetical protein
VGYLTDRTALTDAGGSTDPVDVSDRADLTGNTLTNTITRFPHLTTRARGSVRNYV